MTTQPTQDTHEERGGVISVANHAYHQVKDELIMLDIRAGEPINDVLRPPSGVSVGPLSGRR